MCREEFLHYLRIREWQDLTGQLRSIARSGVSRESAGTVSGAPRPGARRPGGRSAVAYRPSVKADPRDLPPRGATPIVLAPGFGAHQTPVEPAGFDEVGDDDPPRRAFGEHRTRRENEFGVARAGIVA